MRWNYRLLGLFLLLFAFFGRSNGQVIFSNGTQTNQGEYFHDIEAAADGGFYMIYSRYGVGGLCKTDGAGNMIWSKQISAITPYSILELGPQDEVYISSGAVLSKVSSAGVPIWTVTLSFSVEAFDVAADGEIFCARFTEVWKLDANGAVVWGKTISGIYRIEDVVASANGGLYLVANNYSSVNAYYRGVMVKLSDQGAVVWSRQAQDMYMKYMKVVETADMEVTVVANNWANSVSFLASNVLRFDANGTQLWSMVVEEPGLNDHVTDLTGLSDNGVAIAGESSHPLPGTYRDVYSFRLSSQGALNRFFGGLEFGSTLNGNINSKSIAIAHTCDGMIGYCCGDNYGGATARGWYGKLSDPGPNCKTTDVVWRDPLIAEVDNYTTTVSNYTITTVTATPTSSSDSLQRVPICHYCLPLATIAGSTHACVGVPGVFYKGPCFASDSVHWFVNGISVSAGDTLHWSSGAAGVYQIGMANYIGPCIDTVITSFQVFTGPPVPNFNYFISGPLTASFTDLSVNAQTYFWDFGDGATSTNQYPTHTYASNGMYTVCLTAMNNCDTVTICQTMACPFPIPAFVVNPNGMQVSITDQSLNGVSQSWDFGDGNTAVGTVSSHTYSSAGNFNICQTVTNGCGSATVCYSVIIVSNSNFYYRENLSYLGTAIPMGTAAAQNGRSMVVGESSQGAFMLLVDTVGTVLWTKTFPSANYELNDVAAMPNGNFLVVGGTTQAGVSSMTEFWMEVDQVGNVVRNQAVDGGYPYTSVNNLRYGGYFLCSNRKAQYAKLDANLQMQWKGNEFLSWRVISGFQAPDSSYWLVVGFPNSTGEVWMVQLGQNGAVTAGYVMPLYNNGPSSAYFEREAAQMDCNGNIFYAGAVDFNYQGNWAYALAIGKFNTQSRLGTNMRYDAVRGVGGQFPNLRIAPSEMVLKPDGNLRLFGSTGISGFNYPDARELMVIDINASNLSATMAAFGTAPVKEEYLAACTLPSGAYFCAGISDTSLSLHKFNLTTQCQLPTSNLVYTFQPDPNYTSNPAVSTGISFTPYGNLLAWPISPATTSGAATLQCASFCTSNLTAGFTYVVNGNTVTLTSTSSPGANLTWTIPGMSCLTGSPVTVTLPCGSTSISLTASDGCGFRTATQTIAISGGTSNQPFYAPNLLSNLTQCLPGSATISAASGYSQFLWSNGATTSFTTINAPGSISLVAQQASNSCYYTDTATVTVTPFSVTLGADQQRCPGGSATFSVSSGFTSYAWSNGATSNSITVSTPGNYAVTVTNALGCIATDTVNLSNYTVPAVSIGPNQSVCFGTSATFTATSGFNSYLWSTGATTSSVSVSAGGTYSVTATGANGCTSTASATLTTNNAGAVSIGPNQTICAGSSATFTATSGFATYLWSNGATTSSIIVSASGTYSVTATHANGCVRTASATLTVNPAPPVSIGPNQTICSGSSATFTASPGFSSYLWSNGATTSSITVSANGVYTVTATHANGCVQTATATLTVNSVPQVSIGPNQTVCQGTSWIFSATPGFTSHLWSNGATTNAITVTAPGLYAVTATHANGCTSTASATLSNFAAPIVSIGPNQTVCPGASTNFTATAGFWSYQWNTGSPAINIFATTPGTYSVSIVDTNGCAGSASATLSNYPAAVVNIGPDQTICPGTNAIFTANSGFSTYNWSQGGTTNSITVNSAGTYSVIVIDANNCWAFDTASVSLHPTPAVSIGPNQTVCPGTNATFAATPGFSSYLWSTGATTSSVSVSASGQYSVTATNANGCTATASAMLSNFPALSVSIGPNQIICNGDTISLTATSGFSTYLWSTGATTSSVNVSTTGVYAVTATNANGCLATASTTVTVEPDCVWPGDANHDGIADNQDLLAVGYGFGFSGALRPSASSAWFGQPAPNWPTALPNLVNHKHPDCDGNGTVNFTDTTLIVTNYGLTHNKGTGITAGIPLFVVPEQDSFPVGDTVFFQVHWGDLGTPVNNGHGVAFSIAIDAPQVTPGTIYARYPVSFLGNGVPDLLTLTYPAPLGAAWHIGISRKDRLGRNGTGAVMRVGFLPAVVYPLTSTLGYVPIRLENAVAVDGSFAPMLVSALGDSILIYSPSTTQLPALPIVGWNLYPVPTDRQAVLELNLQATATVAAVVVDMHGRIVKRIPVDNAMGAGINRFIIETSDLAEGMYFVRVTVAGHSEVKKLFLAR